VNRGRRDDEGEDAKPNGCGFETYLWSPYHDWPVDGRFAVAQLHCECGATVSFDCSVTMPDGTPSGLRLCKPCTHSADPLCPACGEFARMRPCQNSHQQWFECTACGAAMDEDEIDSAQRTRVARPQPGIATAHVHDGIRPEVAEHEV
jgi:Zn ribbon nucleic-acid-binding protein